MEMSEDVLALWPLIFFIPAFILLRFTPMWKMRARGCDAYYFLETADAFRQKPRMPITLPPLYLLELEEQWYPPGFSIILGLLPKEWLSRNYWAISNFFDLLIFCSIVSWISMAYGVVYAGVAGFAYASSPMMVQEYASLTSRALASVLIIPFLVGSYVWVEYSTYDALAVATIFGFLLLYTHKLSIQLLWFLVPFFSLIEAEVQWLVPLVASYTLALVVGRSYFCKILKAHYDIVTFWNRNWKNLGANLIHDSPLYGGGRHTASFHQENWLSLAFGHSKRLIGYNIWLLVVLYLFFDNEQLTGFELFLVKMVVGIYVWASLVLFIPFLRCLGEGTKYLKYATPPSIVLLGNFLIAVDFKKALVLGVCFGVQAFLFYFIWKRLGIENVGNVSILTSDMKRVISKVGRSKDARIICLPTNMADQLAHFTRKPVLWGGHGYGFRTLEEFFPIIRKPIGYFVKKYQITHLLLDTRYVSPEKLELKGAVEIECGDLILYSLDRQFQGHLSAT